MDPFPDVGAARMAAATVIVSPTEPAGLRALGEVSMFPEKMGCDMVFACGGRWAGIQRKEFKDLVHSVEDGRLGEQVQKMVAAPLEYRLLVIEGVGRWTDEGNLITRYGRGLVRAHLRKLLWSVRDQGVWIDSTDSLDDTVQLCQAFEEWCRKPSHKSLTTRPGPRSPWGKASNREWLIHFLQGLPGVGVELAGRIVDEFDGSPVGWKIEMEDLMRVDGIGKKKAKSLWEALNDD